jgi:hypothetical protein
MVGIIIGNDGDAEKILVNRSMAALTMQWIFLMLAAAAAVELNNDGMMDILCWE